MCASGWVCNLALLQNLSVSRWWGDLCISFLGWCLYPLRPPAGLAIGRYSFAEKQARRVSLQFLSIRHLLIDKTNAVEHQGAINSMVRWYCFTTSGVATVRSKMQLRSTVTHAELDTFLKGSSHGLVRFVASGTSVEQVSTAMAPFAQGCDQPSRYEHLDLMSSASLETT